MADIDRIGNIGWESDPDKEDKESETLIPLEPWDLIEGRWDITSPHTVRSDKVPSVSETHQPLTEPVPLDKISNSTEVIRNQFLSFNPFEGIDADLSREEAMRLFEHRVALTKLARHFEQQAREIKSLLNKAKGDSEKNWFYGRQAAAIACATLDEVLNVEYLREGTKLLAWARNRYLDEVVAILTCEIEAFFEVEKRLFVEHGVSDESAIKIVADCREVFENMRTGQVHRGQVLEAIGQIKRATCDLSTELKRQANQERKREQTWRRESEEQGSRLWCVECIKIVPPGVQR